MAVQLGTAVILKMGSITIAKGKTLSFSRSANMVDVTNKDSGGDQEVLPGMRSGSFQFEGLFSESDTTGAGFSLLFGYQNAGTKVTAKMGSTTTGEKTYACSVYISDLAMSAPNLDAQTFTCTLTMTGPVTEATN